MNKNTYPAVIIDKDVNFENSNHNIKSLTVEEWVDINHHTHNISTLLDSNGNYVGDLFEEVRESLADLNDRANNTANQIRVINNRIDLLDRKTTNIGNDLAQTKEDLAQYKTSVDDRIVNTLELINTYFNKHEEDITNLSDSINSIMDTLNENIGDINNIKSQVTDLYSKFTEFNQKLDEIKVLVDKTWVDVLDWDVDTEEIERVPNATVEDEYHSVTQEDDDAIPEQELGPVATPEDLEHLIESINEDDLIPVPVTGLLGH